MDRDIYDEDDDGVTDEEELDSQNSEQWLDIIKGNVQKGGANQNESGPSKKAGDKQEGTDTIPRVEELVVKIVEGLKGV